MDDRDQGLADKWFQDRQSKPLFPITPLLR